MLLRSSVAEAGANGCHAATATADLLPIPANLERAAVPLRAEFAWRDSLVEPDWAELWTQDGRVGRLVAGTDLRILWASSSARALIGPSAPITTRYGVLIGSSKGNQERLERLVADALVETGRVDALFSASEGAAASIAVQARAAPGGRAVALQLRDLTIDSRPDLPDLGRLYGLTPTENRIVRFLLEGLSVGEISERLGTSVLTVRTHLKRSYSKLGISTKEQLFARILMLV